MDSFTHIAIGACIGEIFFEKGFGKKAMLWGALAQSLPDIDFAAHLWLSTPDALLAHRGFTHSFFFAILISPVLTLVADKVHRPRKIPFLRWLLFFTVQLLLHLLLDVFNNYGIGWLEPFSHERFSFNILYVVDPFFSLFTILAFVFLLLTNRYHLKRVTASLIGVIAPFFYVIFCMINKFNVDNQVAYLSQQQKIPYQKLYTTPAPLQNWLWYIILKGEGGFWIGYYSLFDKKKEINFHYFSSQENDLNEIAAHEDFQKLVRFSQGYYIVNTINNQIIFNDLRFGQMFGWEDFNNDFVFHYLLKHDKNSNLLIQQGRFRGWNRDEMKIYWKRVFGYQ